ncbi:MAG: hypothetical protein AAFS10_19980 [Myxococcota bacterium]
MARRRKKRAASTDEAHNAPSNSSSEHPEDSSSAAQQPDDTLSMADEPSDPIHTEPSSEVTPLDLDRSCLIHPGRDTEHTCDQCSEELCSMCAVPFGDTLLCATCFTTAMKPEHRRGGFWQGWLAMVLGCIAVGAASIPLSGGAVAQMATLLPGGQALLDYTVLFSSVCAIALGFTAQDFPTLGQRAGVVGALCGLLTLMTLLGLQARQLLG